MKNTTLIAALLLGLSASTTYAADADTTPENPRPRVRQGPPGGAPRRQMAQARAAEDRRPEGAARPEGARQAFAPLIRVLDANGDHVLDATEIDHASRALRKLDRNGDGQITPRELRLMGARGPGGPDNAGDERPRRGPGRPGGAGARDGTGPRHPARPPAEPAE